MLTETQVYITLSNELYYNYYRLCFCCCCVGEHIKYNFIYLKKNTSGFELILSLMAKDKIKHKITFLFKAPNYLL